MGYVPDKSFPFRVVYDGALCEGRILPLRLEGQLLPDTFRILVGGLVFVQLHNNKGTWIVSEGEEIEPGVIEAMIEYIKSFYQ